MRAACLATCAETGRSMARSRRPRTVAASGARRAGWPKQRTRRRYSSRCPQNPSRPSPRMRQTRARTHAQTKIAPSGLSQAHVRTTDPPRSEGLHDKHLAAQTRPSTIGRRASPRSALGMAIRRSNIGKPSQRVPTSPRKNRGRLRSRTVLGSCTPACPRACLGS